MKNMQENDEILIDNVSLLFQFRHSSHCPSHILYMDPIQNHALSSLLYVWRIRTSPDHCCYLQIHISDPCHSQDIFSYTQSRSLLYISFVFFVSAALAHRAAFSSPPPGGCAMRRLSPKGLKPLLRPRPARLPPAQTPHWRASFLRPPAAAGA